MARTLKQAPGTGSGPQLTGDKKQGLYSHGRREMSSASSLKEAGNGSFPGQAS